MINSLYLNPKDYDQQYLDLTRDIPFYLDLAHDYGHNLPILEFACGTLRITRELARTGYQMIGVDISEPMLTWGRQKLMREDAEVQSRITLYQGDMCEIHLESRHALIIVPFNSFLQLLNTEDQIRALENMREHLAVGGHLLADIHNPNIEHLSHDMSRHPSPTFLKRIAIENGQILTRYTTRRYYPSTQQTDWYFSVEIYDARTGELVRKYMSDIRIRNIFPNEWRLLLSRAGFEITAEWGDYDRNPFDDHSPQMLFLARRVSNSLPH